MENKNSLLKFICCERAEAPFAINTTHELHDVNSLELTGIYLMCGDCEVKKIKAFICHSCHENPHLKYLQSINDNLNGIFNCLRTMEKMKKCEHTPDSGFCVFC
jgi:hypothetical protein